MGSCLGIAKIVFDNVEGLQPYGYLIGDEDTSGSGESIADKLKKRFRKAKKN
jgi:hypothetical protein